jgi:hypothetical protein
MRIPTKLALALAMFSFPVVAFSQSELQKRTLVINGHSGEATIYRIDGRAFISLEALVRIGNGSLSFQGDEIILNLPLSAAVAAPADTPAANPEMSNDFMKAAVQNLGIIKDWHTLLAHAIQRGVPGDGSRLVVFRDRAAEGLRLTTLSASSSADQDALKLLSNQFNQVDGWTRKLIKERKAMSTGKYSMTPDALDSDSQYQKIVSCEDFLGKMLVDGRYSDDGSCH